MNTKGLSNIEAKEITKEKGFEEEIKQFANNIKELDLNLSECNIDEYKQNEIVSQACVNLVRTILADIEYWK